MKTLKRSSALALVAALLIPAAILISCIDFPQISIDSESQGSETTEIIYESPVSGGGFRPTLTGGSGYEPEAITDPSAPVKAKGYIQLNVNVEGSGARTIIPDTSAITDVDWFDQFDILCVAVPDVGGGGTTSGTTKNLTNQAYSFFSTPLELDTGWYDITIIAKKSDGETTPTYFAMAAGGVEEEEVDEDVPSTVNIDLKEIVDGTGNGKFTYDFDNTGDYDTANMVITPYGVGSPVSRVLTSVSDDEIDLPSGYYRVVITLTKDKHATRAIPDILHIYQGHSVAYPATSLPALRVSAYDVFYFYGDGESPDKVDMGDVNHASSFATPANPTHRGGSPLPFGGWYSDSGRTTAQTFPITNVRGDINLYIKWLVLGVTITPNVEFTDDLSPVVNVSDTAYTVNAAGAASIATLTFSLATPGPYSNIKWYLDDDADTVLSTNDTLIITLASDIKFRQDGNFDIIVYAERGGIPYSTKSTFSASYAP